MSITATRTVFLKLFVGAAMALLLCAGAWAWDAHQVKAQTPIQLKLLVILVNFTDDPYQTITQAQANALYFGAAGSVQSFYLANSGGRIQFTGQVVGWYTVKRSSTNCATDYFNWGSLGKSAAQAAGINVAAYQYIQYVFPRTCSSGSGMGSYGTAGQYPPSTFFGPLESWIFGYMYTFPFSHELGHNLGNGHADTPSTVYGDTSDVMGNGWLVSGYAPMMFNAPHQVSDKWTDAGEVQTISSGSQTVTLNSLESGSGLRIVKIPKASSPPTNYYLSYRQATGIDANIPASFTTGASVTQWDNTATDDTYLQTTLADGGKFTDAANNITVQQVSHTASSVTLNVSVNATVCTTLAPTITTSPAASISGAPGDTVSFKVNITDNDSGPCSSTSYTVALPSYAGTFTPSPTITLMPGQTQSVTVSFTIPTTATPSATPTSVLYNITTGSVTKGYVMNLFVTAPACTAAAPTFTATPASVSVLAGKAQPYVLIITNNDSAGCTGSTFVLTPPALPAGWTNTFSAPSVLLAPGATAKITATTTSPLTAPVGTTSVAFVVSDALASIHTVSAAVQYAVASIPCVATAPAVSTMPSSWSDGAPGVPKQYTLTISNTDTAGCSQSTFTFAPSIPAGWTSSGSTANVTLLPGQSGNIVETVTPAASASSGTTTVPIAVKDAATAIHNGSVSVLYAIPPCVRQAPLISASPTPQSLAAGAPATYNTSVTNQDSASCPASTFSLSATAPVGWSSSFAPATISLAPGTFGYSQLQLTSPATAALGSYPFTVTVTDGAVPVHAATASAEYDVANVPSTLPLQKTLSISATRVKSGASSKLSWYISAAIPAGVSCSVTPAASIQSGSPTTISGGPTVGNWGTKASPNTALTVPVTGPIVFTLSCTNGAATVSAQATAGLLPNTKEI